MVYSEKDADFKHQLLASLRGGARTEPDQEVVKSKFADTLAHLKHGRVASEALSKAAQQKQPQRESPPAEFDQSIPKNSIDARVINTIVDNLKSKVIRPEDINGYQFETMTIDELRTLATNLSILAAFPLGILHRNIYCTSEFQWYENEQQKIDACQVGTVCFGPIAHQLLDEKVGPDDLERADCQHGSIIEKNRFFVVIERHGNRARVATSIRFGDRKIPRDQDKFSYTNMILEGASLDGLDPDLPLLEWRSSDQRADQNTFLEHAHPIWISLKNMPIAIKGQMSKAYYGSLAHDTRLSYHSELAGLGRQYEREKFEGQEEQASRERERKGRERRWEVQEGRRRGRR